MFYLKFSSDPEERYRQILRNFTTLTLFANLAGFYSSAVGLRTVTSDPFLTWGGALVLNAIAFGFWTFMDHEYPYSTGLQQQTYNRLIIGATVLLFFGVCMWTVVAFGARDASTAHMRAQLDKLNRVTLAKYERARESCKVCPHLKTFAAQYEAAAENELQGKGLSGLGGGKQVHNTLINAASLFRQTAEGCEREAQAVDDKYAVIKRSLHRGDEIITQIEMNDMDDVRALRLGTKQFGEVLSEVNEQMVALTPLSGFVEALLGRLETLVPPAAGAQRQEQKDALLAVKGMFTGSRDTLLQVMPDKKNGSIAEEEDLSYAVPSPALAILLHPQRVYYAIALGLMQDGAPLLFLLCLKAKARKREEAPVVRPVAVAV